MKIFRMILIYIAIFIISVSSCKKDNECHYDLIFINNSSEVIHIAQVTPKINNDSCSFFGVVSLPPNQKVDYNIISRRCIEDQLKAGQGFAPTYIVGDSTNFEKSFKCDSVYTKNKILKEVVFSLDQLKASNFTFNYP